MLHCIVCSNIIPSPSSESRGPVCHAAATIVSARRHDRHANAFQGFVARILMMPRAGT
jgi:predicted nucleic acid-binding Zn ribbon protein